jgi:hypothetical protein
VKVGFLTVDIFGLPVFSYMILFDWYPCLVVLHLNWFHLLNPAILSLWYSRFDVTWLLRDESNSKICVKSKVKVGFLTVDIFGLPVFSYMQLNVYWFSEVSFQLGTPSMRNECHLDYLNWFHLLNPAILSLWYSRFDVTWLLRDESNSKTRVRFVYMINLNKMFRY